MSSYGDGTKSSGIVKLNKDLDESIEGKDVIIVEDILDSGRTLSYLVKLLGERKPASLEVVTLLDKPDRRVIPVELYMTGLRSLTDLLWDTALTVPRSTETFHI